MNVWCHLPTIFSQRRTLQFAGLLTLCVALITTLFLSVVASAAPGVNQTLSFQGRLLDSQGSVVPDGYYNIQFKIYQDGTGTAAGNPNGTLKWTETRVNAGTNSGVLVKNGYLSVDLGSQTPFGNSIDWNQDTLWLSMNIAGSSGVCTTFGSSPCLADGEMLPMKRLTASPYAINSGQLGGITADGFIKNSTTQQTGDFNISGTGIVNSLQASTSVLSGLFDRADSGTLSIGSTNATAITIGSATADQSISIGSGSGNNTVSIGSASGSSGTSILGGSSGVSIASSGDITLGTDATDTLTIANDGTIATHQNSQLIVNGSAQFNNGIIVQGNSLSLLTAINNNGQANIGIGNSASAGYALDVTGDVNASAEYYINGVRALNNTALSFSGDDTSTVSSATGQALALKSDSSVAIEIGENTSATFGANSVQIGNGTADGEPTLLTVDRASSAPLATGDALLGSMYYDTTVGKLQCYEADGWGSCSASPDTFVSLSPEYANAVTNGSDDGELTSDFCSDTLGINNDSGRLGGAICEEDQTYNFYNWKSSSPITQTKSIYVSYELPSNFKEFVANSTSLLGRSDGNDSAVTYQIYRNSGSGLVLCGSEVEVAGSSTGGWQQGDAVIADPASCNFNAGDTILFKINLTSADDKSAYASNLRFAFSNN